MVGRTFRGWLAWIICGAKGHEWLYWGGGLMYCSRCVERRPASPQELDAHDRDGARRRFYEAHGPTG